MYLIVPIKQLSPSASQESRSHLQLQSSKLPSPLNFILFHRQFASHCSVLASSVVPRRSVLFVLTPHSPHQGFPNIKHLRNHHDNPTLHPRDETPPETTFSSVEETVRAVYPRHPSLCEKDQRSGIPRHRNPAHTFNCRPRSRHLR